MPLKTYQDQGPELNLTPMIDIVFLLIIFFMVGTKFAELERTVTLDVPRVSQLGALTSVTTRRVVNVFQDGSIYLDQQPVTVGQLQTELRQALALTPELGVVVRGDAAGPFQSVATVLNACRQSGIRDLGISVQLDGPAP